MLHMFTSSSPPQERTSILNWLYLLPVHFFKILDATSKDATSNLCHYSCLRQ